MADLVKDFLDAINQVSQSNIDSTAIDLTVEAKVITQHNVEVGEYKVEYQGNTFSAFSPDVEIVYQKGDKVYVLVPQGDFSNEKIIIGKASGTRMSYQDRTTMTNYYIPKGPNWVSPTDGWYDMLKQELEVCVTPEEGRPYLVHPPANWKDIGYLTAPEAAPEAQTDYPTTYMNNEQIDAQNVLLQRYGDAFDYVMVKADFRTELNMIHSKGQYMLEIQCFVTDPTAENTTPISEKYQLTTFKLGFGDFIGAPYQYAAATTNVAYFKVGKGIIKGLHKVSLIQDGSFLADITPTYSPTGERILDPANTTRDKNNIFATNIDIRFAEKVNLTDNLYNCWIETPQGDSVYSVHGAVPGRPSVDLIAKLFYGYQDILNEENCEVIWFREKLDVTIATPDPEEKDEHGKTWFDYGGPGWYPIDLFNAEETNPAKQYEVDFNRLVVPREAIPWKWRYKVVIIYNGKTVMSAIQSVVRGDSKYSLQLEQLSSNDNSEVLLRIDDAKDASNREWFGEWWSDLTDGSYELLTKDPRYHLGPYNVTKYLINDVITFRVACYDPIISNAGNDGVFVESDPVGYLEKTMISPDAGDLFVEWVGKDTFTYDVAGSVKPWVGDQENTLYAKLKWREGTGSDYKLEILSPIQSILGGRSDTGQGLNIADSMMTQMWVDFENVIHFKVREKYDLEKTNNTFTLRLTTYKTGEIIEFSKEVKFLKDGDQGTQGSDWIAPIKPCTWDTTVSPAYAKYSEKAEFVTPLVLSGAGSTNLTEDWHYRVVLRPFVQKNGTPLEDLPKDDGYYYTVDWDVRYPQSMTDEQLRGGSWLRLRHPGGGLLTSTTHIAPALWGAQNGRVGTTNYRGDIGTDYGAVEIGFQNGLDNNFKLGNYNFQVKATINIYEKGNPEGDGIEVGSGEKVATINAFYPIDIFIDYDNAVGAIDLDTSKLYTNWPQFVEYNTTGYDPLVMQHPLVFRYGDNSRSTFDPSPNHRPENLCPYLQTIEEVRGELYYRPKTHYFWQEGTNGALGTHPTDTPFSGNKVYMRTVIYRLNNYGNVDANAWDGQGIDIKEDEGTLFAPTVGAGYKDAFTNTFTGVIMGIDKSQKKKGRGGTAYAHLGAGFTSAEAGARPGYRDNDPKQFMTGLYGYQDGYGAFGIMENGTAFFGRADHGGRVIIDGFNATIYGGGNGKLEDPYIGDPMWNTMRLNFVDLTHSVNGNETDEANTNFIKTSLGQVDKNVASVETGGVQLGFRGHYFGDETQRGKNRMPVWLSWVWKRAYKKGYKQVPYFLDKENYENFLDELYTYPPIPPGTTTYEIPGGINYWDAGSGIGQVGSGHNLGPDDLKKQLTGFGPSRASTTPAIEIGQHQEGLMPGILQWNEMEPVFRDLFIPGNRNFMVTYDGTMWAMNGVFMGNIIGSNILGGRIQGAEIGIGKPNDGFQDFTFKILRNPLGDWEWLVPPEQKEITVSYGQTYDHYYGDDVPDELTNFQVPPTAFYVDDNGNAHVKTIRVYGGMIDIGSFHLRDEMFEGSNNAEDNGYMYMGGYVDFVGPVHCYGNLGIGPALGEDGRDDAAAYGGSTSGNLFQTAGKVGMGISLPYSNKTEQGNETGHNHTSASNRWEQGKMNDIIRYRNFGITPNYSSTLMVNGDRRTNYSAYLQPELIDGLEGVAGEGLAGLQVISTFGIDSTYGSDGDSSVYQADGSTNVTEWVKETRGHFYPVYFTYRRVGKAYSYTNLNEQTTVDPRDWMTHMTTMDLFMNPSTYIMGPPNGGGRYETLVNAVLEETGQNWSDVRRNPYYRVKGTDTTSRSGLLRYFDAGSNYFRIGNTGAETMTLLLRKSFLSEDKQTLLSGADYGGYFGTIWRDGGGGADKGMAAIGLESWGRYPLIFRCDENYALRVRNSGFVSFGVKNRPEQANIDKSFQATLEMSEDIPNMGSGIAEWYTTAHVLNRAIRGVAWGENQDAEQTMGIVWDHDPLNNHTGLNSSTLSYVSSGEVGLPQVAFVGVRVSKNNDEWGAALLNKKHGTKVLGKGKVWLGTYDSGNITDGMHNYFEGKTLGAQGSNNNNLNTVGFFGDWAKPDNQHHIYARFG